MRTTGNPMLNSSKNGPIPQAEGAVSFTLEQLYRRGRAALAALPGAGDNSPMEAAFLFRHIFGIGREELFLRGQEPASPEQAGAFFALIRRRLEGEPLQYLLGEWEFYGLDFFVGPGVLIPRPETELLVEAALESVGGIPSPSLLDLCSGSGCIPIALGHALPEAQAWGAELSPPALGYFRQNLAAHRLPNVTAVEGDIFALPEDITWRRYHAITANPPYIPKKELPNLQAEVQREPPLALDGGEDGLDFYRRLPGICLPLLEPGGWLLLEIGEGQGEAVSSLLAAAGFQHMQVKADLSGLERLVRGQAPRR